MIGTGGNRIWTLAPATADLDPARYLGELRELPPPEQPGDWCHGVVADEQGVVRWKLVVVEHE